MKDLSYTDIFIVLLYGIFSFIGVVIGALVYYSLIAIVFTYNILLIIIGVPIYILYEKLRLWK